MSLQAFLDDLRQRGIQFRADGERLHCNAPTGLLTPQLRERIGQRKSEILAFLRTAGALARQQRAIIPLQPRGSRTPVYAVAGHNGDVFAYRTLTRYLGEDQPFFGLQPPGFDEQNEPLASVEALAGYFATQITAFQPEGPYIIAGYCAGGSIAFELARQLQQRGAAISFLALFASPFPTTLRFWAHLAQRLGHRAARIGRHVRALSTLPPAERNRYIAARILGRKARRDAERAAALDPSLSRRAQVARTTVRAVRRYVPGSFSGRVGLFLPSREWLRSGAAPLRWRSVAARTEELYGPGNCEPDLFLLEPDSPAIARLFNQFRDKCDGVRDMNARTGGLRDAATQAPLAEPVGNLKGSFK